LSENISRVMCYRQSALHSPSICPHGPKPETIEGIMKENVVLIGAGSAMFTRGLVADLIRRRQPCELGLIDIDPRALAVAEGLTRKMIDAKQAPIRLRASTDRRAVLPGATVVICTVGVGGRRAWEQDVFIPRKYGIYQPVGDTVMP